MIQAIQLLMKAASAIMKLAPSLLEVLADFADDGKLNQSNK